MGFRGHNRYGNKRAFVDDQWFDSGYESECWLHLKDLEKEGIIYDLSRDKEDCQFDFKHNGVHIARAKFDFSFSIEGIQRRIIADAKSPATIDFQRFKWQTKMILAFYDLPVIVFLQNHNDVWPTVLEIKDKGVEEYLIGYELGLKQDRAAKALKKRLKNL